MVTIKNIILFALISLMIVGCKHRTDTEIEEAGRLSDFNLIIVDSCEYLKAKDGIAYQGYGFFAHKGNCRFCKERKKQELKELVERLKEK